MSRGTAGNPGRVEVLLGTYAGRDPGEAEQMKFIVCLHCGYYMPDGHPGLRGWKDKHGVRCEMMLKAVGRRARNLGPHSYFYICRDPDSITKTSFPLTSELTETELLAFSLQGLE